MNESIAVLIFSILVSFYLAINGDLKISGGGSKDPSQSGGDSSTIPSSIQNNLLLIEHLTQHLQTFKKNYRNGPDKFSEFGYNVIGTMHSNGQDVELSYTYPILNRKNVTFSVSLNPIEVSAVVDAYGAKEDGTVLKGIEIITQGSKKVVSMQYPYVVDLSNQFASKIAEHIVGHLQTLGKDDYVSRVLAAKNFVQHLNYGIPKFEIPPYEYIELALPYESFVLSYSDCDSKSVFMASILKEMIDADNIVLVSCQMGNPSIPGEIGGHMFIAVAGMPFSNSSTADHNGKTYHFIETTTPHVPDGSPMRDIFDIELHPLVVC